MPQLSLYVTIVKNRKEGSLRKKITFKMGYQQNYGENWTSLFWRMFWLFVSVCDSSFDRPEQPQIEISVSL